MTVIDDSTPVFLQGNGRPVTEERTVTDLAVTGSLPAELDGRYVRNGANPLTGVADHPFFGDGMVHGVRLRDGKAEWYRNRYVQTPFIANPDIDILDPAVLMDVKASKANTNVIGHAGKIFALEEGHLPYVLDGELTTVGPTDFGGMLSSSFTAHPKICPVTGELLAFGYAAFEPYLRYYRISADGTMVQNEDITVNGPTMMHDFNITQNHVIFMDLPAVFDLDMAMRGEMPIHWDDNYPSRLGVMPRNGTDADVRWYDINPCYVFHPMNAYEAGDKIVLDVARLDHIWRDSMMDFPSPQFWRFTIDTTTGKVHEEQVDDRPGEFHARRRLGGRPPAPLRLHDGHAREPHVRRTHEHGRRDREVRPPDRRAVGNRTRPGKPSRRARVRGRRRREERRRRLPHDVRLRGRDRHEPLRRDGRPDDG